MPTREQKNNAQETAAEEVASAMGGSVVVAQDTQVSANVAVSGVKLDFPFVRIGHGMSQWRTAETRNGKPEEGAFYVGKDKTTNFKIAESGKEGGLYGIVLAVYKGFKEVRPYNPGNNVAPQRWLAAGLNSDGTPVTEKDCLDAAAEAGFSLAPRPTGEVWADSGRPKMAANLDRFCYLCMLVPVPDTFETDDFRLYPIGDHLYTTVRFEFDKQYFKQFDSVMANIESRAKFTHRSEPGYAFSPIGMVGHIYTYETTNRAGQPYTSHSFEKALRDGRPWEFTPAEKEDFAKFLMSVKDTTAAVDDVESGEF